MTPQEIFEYKHTWLKTGYMKPVDEWLEYTAKGWCREHLESHRWHFTKWVDVYDHGFWFELEEEYKAFCEFLERDSNG